MEHEHCQNNRQTTWCAFVHRATSVQCGFAGYISHYQARELANTLASLGYNKKCVEYTCFLSVINHIMLFGFVQYV